MPKACFSRLSVRSLFMARNYNPLGAAEAPTSQSGISHKHLAPKGARASQGFSLIFENV